MTAMAPAFAGDLPDPHQLVEEYLGLAHSIAQQVWRNAPHALELEEMRGIANFGLVDAATKWEGYCAKNNFDPWELRYFKPYCVRRVHGALIDAIRSADWATRSLRTKAKLLLEAGSDKGATEKELSERTGLTIKEIRMTRRGMSQRPTSLEGEEYEPVAPTDVESSLIAADVLGAFVDSVRTLTRQEQAVLALHYYGGYQLQQVARALGVTDTRASELHASAVMAAHAAMIASAEHAVKGDL